MIDGGHFGGLFLAAPLGHARASEPHVPFGS